MSDNLSPRTDTKLREYFRDMIVYKDPKIAQFFLSLGIPSYLRDWLIMRFSDESGLVDLDAIGDYVNKFIPRAEHWERLKARMRAGERVRFLAKVRVEIDVRKGLALFALPDLGFPKRKYEAIIDDQVLRTNEEELLSEKEPWGVIELAWVIGVQDSVDGAIKMVGFQPFCPYEVSLDYYREASQAFGVSEWVDELLMAIDYNPNGFLTIEEKIAMLSRLLPFVERRLNIVELAPKGTGKSYVFSRISKYGWLISGGSVSRARLFYDIGRRTVGIISRSDYVALDEVQTISFSDDDEMRGALKGYMESGDYRIGDYRGVGEAGIVLLGNIDIESMRDDFNMFLGLPEVFRESALIDRFHGFLRGWEIPRMRENMKARGWALNSEYFSEIMHGMRSDLRYRATVDHLLRIPRGADTRDTEAIKRLTTGYLKLLFPYCESPGSIDSELFSQYCLGPAMKMRSTIRKQLHLMDPEYTADIPNIEVK